ncbi:MAG: hypothetical protein IJ747_07605 [Lachnospiraceae bacterium]|nr:hypothetical protein [Lachnospiraceae bacterium]
MKRKITALFLAAAMISMTTACTTARNDNNSGSLAENNGLNETSETVQNGTVTNTNYDKTRTGTYTDWSDNTGINEGGANGTDNVSLLDDAGGVVGEVMDDTVNGVKNLKNDIEHQTTAIR